MPNKSQAIADFINKKSSSRNRILGTSIPIKNIQVLPIPSIWDWSVPPLGQLNNDQFEFCDNIPSDCSNTVFIASGSSFSENYNVFLALINRDNFEPKVPFDTNMVINKEPIIAPSNEPVPDGWSRVSDAEGILRWRRIWGISKSPQKWLQSINDPSAQNEQMVLKFDTGPVNLTIDGSQNISIPNEQIIQITITASAWDIITVRPGIWYNSSIISQTLNYPSYLKNPDTVFGLNGFLSCRIAQFMVAFMPSATIDIKTEFFKQNNIDLNNIKGLSVGGLEFTQKDARSIFPKTGTAVFNLNVSTSGLLQLSAQEQQSSPNKAYILAVILEKYQK